MGVEKNINFAAEEIDIEATLTNKKVLFIIKNIIENAQKRRVDCRTIQREVYMLEVPYWEAVRKPSPSGLNPVR